VNDEIRAMFRDGVSDQLPITDVGMNMTVVAKLVLQAGNYRRGRAGRAEELLPHVVINADDFPPTGDQSAYTCRPDETGRTGYKRLHSAPFSGQRASFVE
jgi:hypothetical protein